MSGLCTSASVRISADKPSVKYYTCTSLVKHHSCGLSEIYFSRAHTVQSGPKTVPVYHVLVVAAHVFAAVGYYPNKAVQIVKIINNTQNLQIVQLYLMQTLTHSSILLHLPLVKTPKIPGLLTNPRRIVGTVSFQLST
jgi:hypothetical protein